MNSFLHFHVTVQGASHIRKNIVCQDYSKSIRFGTATAASAADGHGDIRYFRSDIGSRFAVEAALKAMKEFVTVENPEDISKNVDEKICQLKKNIILNWNNKVNRHFFAHPFLEEELALLSENRRGHLENGKYIESAYGTTLIASVMAPTYWFGLQIGDGDCFAFHSDGTFASVPKESGLVGNLTTSLCEPDAIDKFHHIYQTQMPVSIVMSTDGVKNSFTTCENYRKFMQKIVTEFSAGPYKATKENLEKFLTEMTAKGSGDDLSVAGMINREKISDFMGLLSRNS